MTGDRPPRADLWLWLVLALGLAVRLVGLSEPLVDRQAWRQTDTAAIARNYYEEGFDLLHPRVDWRGTTPGYVETNFPLYPFLVACVYALLGGAYEWVGRLLASVFSILAAPLLYCLVRRLYPRRLWTARLAAFLCLAMPLSAYFGRAFMPEALMILLSVASLLTFLRWIERPRFTAFLLAVLASSLCFLVKIPTLYIGFPLVALAWWRWGGWRFLAQPGLWGFALLVLAPSAWWYYHAGGLFEQTGLTFGIWNRHGYDKWSHHLLLDADFYVELGARFIHRVFTPVGAVLVVGGLISAWPPWISNGARLGQPLPRRGAPEWMPYVWLGGLVLYVLLVPEGNRMLHYYQLPFVPVGALFAALWLGSLLDGRLKSACGERPKQPEQTMWPRYLAVSLILVAISGYSAWSAADYYRPGNNVYNYYRSSWEAGRLLDRKIPADALLVIGDYDRNVDTSFRSQSPTLLYYCHRKGWQITKDEIRTSVLDSLAALGADYFVAANGLIGKNPALWRDLQSRGLTYPSAFPRLWRDQSQFMSAVRNHPGTDRHFVIVPLAVAGSPSTVGNEVPAANRESEP